jgi:hypothetical protein
MRFIVNSLGLPPEGYRGSRCPISEKMILVWSTAKSCTSDWQTTIKLAAFRRGEEGKAPLIIAFLEKIFRYTQRMTAEEALKDPLFANEMTVRIDCSDIPREVQKATYLRVQGVVVPLTASSIHLRKTADLVYRVALENGSGSVLSSFEMGLDPANPVFSIAGLPVHPPLNQSV